jgi:DNA-directed RNA polymerase subunit RPC12/RpoP
MSADWEHLKAHGYAPGSYMGNCLTCQKGVTGLDKRAIRCRPCAERLHTEQPTIRMLSRTEVAHQFAGRLRRVAIWER